MFLSIFRDSPLTLNRLLPVSKLWPEVFTVTEPKYLVTSLTAGDESETGITGYSHTPRK